MTRQEETYRSWVEVDLEHFRHNWKELRRLVGSSVKIMQVVKADAYGHGAIEISNTALACGAACLGVANADEGVQLRVSGIQAPIVILSPSTLSEINEILKYDLTPSISDPAFAAHLQGILGKRDITLPVHIEVDTGMGRGGMIHLEALKAIRQIAAHPNLRIEGLFTHFSSSEATDDDYNALQHKLFDNIIKSLKETGIRIPLYHMSNSGGVLNFPKSHLDMVRPGIMTYGIFPGSPVAGVHLEPIMTFKTSIVLIKEFPKGYAIGYNRTFVTSRPTRIATIPVGYGDGYGVILSNQGEALIRSVRAPIVGRVSMDMCTLDVTHIPHCAIGDEVVLLGRQGEEQIAAGEIAAKAHTHSYEIVCTLGKRAPRVFKDQGRTNAIEPRLRRIFIPDEERSISRIDSMIRRCFHTRVKNPELGDAIYYEMFETLFGKENRPLELRTNFKYDIRITDFSEEEKKLDPEASKFFKIKTRIEYCKTLRSSTILIGCALNNEQLAALFDDEACEYRWLFNQRDELFKESDFTVGDVRVDGESLPIVSTAHTDRGYEVWCGGDVLQKKLNTPVKMEIDIFTRKFKSSNLFSVYLVYPTRGLEISFDYEGAGLKNVREVGYFSGKNPEPHVLRQPGKCIRMTTRDDEWIFPTSGVTFVWDV